MVKVLLIVLGAVQASAPAAPGGARSPSWAPDGRIAFAAGGDIWVVSGLAAGSANAPARVTRGAPWDRDPAWGPSGELVFASDRAGGLDLWRVRVEPAGSWGDPQRLTQGAEPETEPVVLPDGSVVFVRGSADASDLWRLHADGREERLTDEPGDDLAPASSHDGRWLAWLAERADGVEVRLLELETRQAGRFPAPGAIDVVWAPDGRRLALAMRGAEGGTWVTDLEGRRQALAGNAAGTLAWSPDGLSLALGAEAPPDVGYNGDPDRVADRDVANGPGDASAVLRVLQAPAETRAATEIALDLGVRDAADFAAEFDRVWERVTHLYAPAADASGWTGGWEAARDRHRDAAGAARTPAELDRAIHALLRDRPPLRNEASGRAAVSSAHPAATAAGVEILEAGGNVVDAAVAVSFAIGVVEPDASGIGGYGEMLIHLAGMSEPVAIEFMTRHPEAIADIDAAERLDGPRRANVPGTVAGMELAWQKYGSGRVSWARVIEPAIRLAEQGFLVSEGLATTLRREWLEFAKYEGARALFFPGGRPLAVGDTLRTPDLAGTLRAIAEGGAAAFYRGDIAKRIAADLGAAGNPLRESDLARYFAAERRPVRTTYRGHAVYAGPPPVTGGAGLTAKLNLLELADPGTSMTDDAATLHALIEAWKLQPSMQNRIADPDLWPVDVTPWESKDTAKMRWRCFDPSRALSIDEIRRGCAGPPGDPALEETPESGNACAAETVAHCRSTGTTAFAVADVDGNAVSVTQTLGTWGGNFYVTPGLGFLYNDKATPMRGDTSAYGAARPFGRVGTVISPAIVYDGDGEDKRPLLAVGAAGNAWITAAVYTMVAGVIDHGLGPQQALELPRMLVGGGGFGFGGQREAMIQIEDGFSPDAIRQLEAMGHRFRRISLRGELRMGYGAAVVVRNGRATAGADPRRSGAAGAVR